MHFYIYLSGYKIINLYSDMDTVMYIDTHINILTRCVVQDNNNQNIMAIIFPP